MQKNKGITLVALVVTIVVLLILAGVSINLVLGENGLITQAKSAREQTKSAESNEKSQMDSASDWISETVNGTELPQTNETKPYMPSSEFKKVDGTNLGNGLVIEDADGNQYVWVEVPMTTTVYPTAGLDIIDFTAEEYSKIENDLHTYTATYRNNTSWKDEYYADTDNSEDWYTLEQYTVQKQKMLKSIYVNGGFWIGRYETGREENSAIPKIKEGLQPYTVVTITEAKKLAETIQYKSEKEYEGSLMYGIQWDLMLKAIEINNIEKDPEIVTKLKNNSTSFGNYRNSTFKINKGSYTIFSGYGISNVWNLYTVETINFVDVNSNKLEQPNEGSGVLLTTGSSEQSSIMNIYDIAGNVDEMTLEKSSNTDKPVALRGGYCLDIGSNYSLAYRNNCSRVGDRFATLGFRVSIY